MRAIIHLNDYDPPDDEIVHDAHCVENPDAAVDDRAVVNGVYTEWYPGGGNIHVTDDRVTQAAEVMDGRVFIEIDTHELSWVGNAELVTVYNE